MGLARGAWGQPRILAGRFARRHLAADLGDGLTYREAFTTHTAQGAVSESGRLVFVFRRTMTARPVAPSDQVAFPKRAA